MVTHEISLSITPIGSPEPIHLNKGDSDFQIVCNLGTRSGRFVLSGGTTAQILGTKPDGEKYQANATVSVEDRVVTVDGDAGMTDAPGIGVFEICLTHARKVLHTQNFKVCIEDI